MIQQFQEYQSDFVVKIVDHAIGYMIDQMGYFIVWLADPWLKCDILQFSLLRKVEETVIDITQVGAVAHR